jgi:hypothetical protein
MFRRLDEVDDETSDLVLAGGGTGIGTGEEGDEDKDFDETEEVGVIDDDDEEEEEEEEEKMLASFPAVDDTKWTSDSPVDESKIERASSLEERMVAIEDAAVDDDELATTSSSSTLDIEIDVSSVI